MVCDDSVLLLSRFSFLLNDNNNVDDDVEPRCSFFHSVSFLRENAFYFLTVFFSLKAWVFYIVIIVGTFLLLFSLWYVCLFISFSSFKSCWLNVSNNKFSLSIFFNIHQHLKLTSPLADYDEIVVSVHYNIFLYGNFITD